MPFIQNRGWAGGENARLPADQIGETEVVAARNVEMDSRSNLRTRPGMTDVSSSTAMTNRITSIFYYETSAGPNTVFATEKNLVRRWDGTTTWTSVAIDAGAAFSSLPTDATWYWRVFNDKAIGVSGDTNGGGVANAVLIDDTSGSATLLDVSSDAAIPNARYIEVDNSRVFLVDADSPNTLVASKLNDAEGADAWSATGIAGHFSVNVGGDEGGRITAIKAFQNQLVIFKRRKVYTLAYGSPNTDTAQWQIQLLLDNVGCISQNSIQEILGDLVFLSDDGILSLKRLLSSGGEAARARVSENIPRLQSVSRSREDYPSALVPDKSQYLISIPTVSAVVNGITEVMDYSLIAVNGSVAWTQFADGMVGSALGNYTDSNGDIRVLVAQEIVGGATEIYQLHNDVSCTAAGANCFLDGAATFTDLVIFRAQNFGEPLIRKRVHRWGFEFGALTDPLALVVKISVDGRDAEARSIDLQFSGLVSGAVWGVDDWDVGLWASEVSPNTDVWRKLTAPSRAQLFQWSVQRTQPSQGVTIKNFGVDVSRLTHRKVSDA